MNEANMAKWLGRPLTPTETANFKTYLNTAKAHLETLLCTSLSCEGGERVYESRDGMRTVFTDYFTGDATVTINGKSSENFSTRFFDNRNSELKNSLVFEDTFDHDEEITIDAAWGFSPLPSDLGAILGQLFAVAAKPYKATGDVKSKRVEDFSITFGERSEVDMVIDSNIATISKYSLCSVGNIISGRTCRVWM